MSAALFVLFVWLFLSGPLRVTCAGDLGLACILLLLRGNHVTCFVLGVFYVDFVDSFDGFDAFFRL